MTEQECDCLRAPLPFDQYEQILNVGTDETNGRFGEVSVRRCKRCGRYWLHYLVEYEAFSKSGRWFMGLIAPERAQAICPEEAVEYLNSLDWHFYGGSYFGGTGKSSGRVQADL
jgi:hypothetical protein